MNHHAFFKQPFLLQFAYLQQVRAAQRRDVLKEVVSQCSEKKSQAGGIRVALRG